MTLLEPGLSSPPVCVPLRLAPDPPAAMTTDAMTISMAFPSPSISEYSTLNLVMCSSQMSIEKSLIHVCAVAESNSNLC